MCIIFIITNKHPDFPIIIAANRDEYYSRPTASAHFWPDVQILAGKDLLAGGTWLGVNRQGYFAAVTNYRQTELSVPSQSRGLLVTHFLTGNHDFTEYFHRLSTTTHDYAGYNCVFGQLSPENSQIMYFSNRAEKSASLNSGIYGLSNALLDTPWPKVITGKMHIETLLAHAFDIEEWLQALRDSQGAEDEDLPDTGLTMATERMLAPIFIQGENYGTRSSTVITVSHTGILSFYERTYTAGGTCIQNQQFSFEIKA